MSPSALSTTPIPYHTPWITDLVAKGYPEELVHEIRQHLVGDVVKYFSDYRQAHGNVFIKSILTAFDPEAVKSL